MLAGARERATPDVVAAYRPLLARLTPADLSGRLLPAISKALRRVPDVALGGWRGLPGGIGGRVAWNSPQSRWRRGDAACAAAALWD